MPNVTKVKKLNKDGKTYNIFYHGQKVLNITLEYGFNLTKEKALAIIKDVARDENVDICEIELDDITFEQGEPEYD